jgi:hypothetical protein
MLSFPTVHAITDALLDAEATAAGVGWHSPPTLLAIQQQRTNPETPELVAAPLPVETRASGCTTRPASPPCSPTSPPCCATRPHTPSSPAPTPTRRSAESWRRRCSTKTPSPTR